LGKIITEEHELDKAAVIRNFMFYHRARRAKILWWAIGARFATRGKHNVNAHISKD
jgi:hypothetical protein